MFVVEKGQLNKGQHQGAFYMTGNSIVLAIDRFLSHPVKQLCVSIGLGTFAGRQPMPPPCPFCPSLTSSPHPHSSFVDPLRPVRRAARLLRLPLRLDCVAHLQRRQLPLARLNPCPVFRSATPTPRLAACCLLPTDRDVHHRYHYQYHHSVAAIASVLVANP